MIYSAVNLSEGRDETVLGRLRSAAGPALVDFHCDIHHNRCVLTLGGNSLREDVRALCRAGVDLIDLARHSGAHPRLGAVDVVPFVALEPSGLDEAVAWRDEHARWMSEQLGVPCFVFGPERNLPDLRRQAFTVLPPDLGPAQPHPRAGATCVGARRMLVAYNLWLSKRHDLADARRIAAGLRGPAVRALGLQVGDRVQVSCNLVDPLRFGPHHAFDAVSVEATVERTELVGLVPWSVLFTVPKRRWSELDLGEEQTIEYRLAAARARARP